MNEKQAKRIRRAMYAFVETDRTSMHPGPKAAEAAGTFAKQLHMMWPALNHKQRGRVANFTRGWRPLHRLSRLFQQHIRFIRAGHGFNLARAVSTAIGFVLA